MLLLASILYILPVLSLPPQTPLKKPETSLPVVFWHGLGDTFDGQGLAKIASLINDTYPGTFVHSIYLDTDPSKDRNAGFFGHVADQVSSPPGVLVTGVDKCRLSRFVNSWLGFLS